MKLISEEIQNAEYLVEETGGKKSYKIKGIFLQSDLKKVEQLMVMILIEVIFLLVVLLFLLDPQKVVDINL